MCGRHSGETVYWEKTLWGSKQPPEGGPGLLEKRQSEGWEFPGLLTSEPAGQRQFQDDDGQMGTQRGESLSG